MSASQTDARLRHKAPNGAKRAKRPVWMESPSVLAQIGKAFALVVSVALVIVPFYAVVATSIASPRAINKAAGGMVLWPGHPTLTAYKAIVSGGVVSRAMAISIGITVVGTLLSLATTAGLAYWLSRHGSFGSKPALMVMLGAVLFAPGIIPSYLVVQEFHLLDNLWSLVLPVMINAFNVIVMRAFFQEMPQELFESAEIDGASQVSILVRIVLPLSKAVLAVIGLFYAVAYWNAFFNALLYINTASKWPMALVLRTYVVNGNQLSANQLAASGQIVPPQLSMQMAILVTAMVPILIVYPFLQRHFAKGVLIGAVKG